MTRVLILPGNGCTPVESCNWYGWLAQELRARGCEVVLTDMPDPMTARESTWLPHVRDVMKCDENSVIVGHSSGAQAAMRYAETTKVAGLVLVSVCVTDLGDENERASGYYNRPWAYDKVRENVSWIVQFGSPDDRFLPAAEQQQVAEGLNSEFHFLKGKDHYMTRREPLILQALVVLKDMPDPFVARETIWLPFIRDVMKCDEDTVIIGHSSGAQAAMRLAENTKLLGLYLHVACPEMNLGIVLVSACVTDLGIDKERASGYYDRPWEYEKMKANVSWIIQFGSPDDPFLPPEEQNQVAAALNSEYHLLPGTEELGWGHYMTPHVPFIMDAILAKIQVDP
ncbi:hypothetical protein AeNC1_000094 [Aphanomyces euteiches]|nr:hypothetical protein AeNC1_000094 [Aphanomyces euteiches]